MKLFDWEKYCLAAIVAVAVFVAGTLSACAGGSDVASGGRSYDGLKVAFGQSSIVEQGVASNAYVEESPYEVTDFAVSEETETEHGFKYAIDAVIENANFTSILSLTGERRGEIISFELLDSSTTAKKGIDFDRENGIEAAESTLSEDGESCTVSTDSPYDYWFIEGNARVTYTYVFDGHKWSYKDMRPSEDYTFKKDIEGEYFCPAGESPQYTDFIISNVDSDKGTFSIAFTQDSFTPGVYQCWESHAELTAGVTIEECSDNAPGRMDNGKLYSFKAQGVTDLGGQVAEMEGYFDIDAKGSPVIVLAKSKVDTVGQNPSGKGAFGEPFDKQISTFGYVMTR